jgi:hypothetical protein
LILKAGDCIKRLRELIERSEEQKFHDWHTNPVLQTIIAHCSGKLNHFHHKFDRQFMPVAFDPFNLVQGFRRKITFAAVRATCTSEYLRSPASLSFFYIRC